VILHDVSSLTLVWQIPSPLPSLSLPFPSSISLPLLGERCKLPQRGLGRSPGGNRIWCILVLKSDICWHQIYCYGKNPLLQSGSAESKISGKLQKTTTAKEKERSEFTSRSRKLMSCLSNYWSGSRRVCQTCSYAHDVTVGGITSLCYLSTTRSSAIADKPPNAAGSYLVWKTRMAGLQSREGRTMIDSVVWAQYINVLDTQMHRQPHRHSKLGANALRQAAKTADSKTFLLTVIRLWHINCYTLTDFDLTLGRIECLKCGLLQ